MINGSIRGHGVITGGLTSIGGVSGGLTAGVGGTSDYNELENKPSINGIILEGNKTSHQLDIPTFNDIPPIIDYSTTPKNTFTKWIDNKDIWMVVVPFSTLYNEMYLSVPTPDNYTIDKIVQINGVATSAGEYRWYVNVPYYHNNNYYIRVYYDVDNKSLFFETTSTQSQYYYNGYIIVKYTLKEI